MVTAAPGLARRSALIDDDIADDGDVIKPLPTTVMPKIDPKVFISKKMDFLTQLFKTLNSTTTIDPTMVTEPMDSTVTTVKPTIVPPGFWVPFPKPATPKPTKTPKTSKSKKVPTPTPSIADDEILKQILVQLTAEPSAPGGKETRKTSFLDALLHRVTEPPTEATASPVTDIETRSLFPPGYWIPPYIYAAKMGIYLDKIFETLDSAASSDDAPTEKRSVVDPSAAILTELTALKNQMVEAYAQGAAQAKVAADKSKTTAKPFKKPFWAMKTAETTTPSPDKVSMLSDIYDQLAALEQQLVGAPSSDPLDPTTSAPSTTNYWAPDPAAAADIASFYKTKTQKYLSTLFSDKPVDDAN